MKYVNRCQNGSTATNGPLSVVCIYSVAEMCLFPYEIDLEKRDLSHYRTMHVLDPSDCAKYYECLEFRNGTIVTTHSSCPTCEFFSWEKKMCVPVHTGPMCGMILVFRNVYLQFYIKHYIIRSVIPKVDLFTAGCLVVSFISSVMC